MKVLHVIPSIAKVKGGPTQIILEMVKALRECGVDAEIATTDDNGDERLDLPLRQRLEYEQVPVWFLPRCFPPLRDFIFSADLTRWLWQHLANYDILQTHYLFSFAPTCAAAIARQQKIPYIVTPHGMLTPWALAHQHLKKQIYSTIERHNLNQAVAIHCSTPEESQDVRNFQVSTPSFIVPYGVHLPIPQLQAKQHIRRAYGIPETTPIILFFSRLHPKKRPDLLLAALNKLASQNHDFHLLMAGSGDPEYLSYLTNLVSSLGLQSQTSMTGFVTGQKKDLLLQGSDLFVLPSFSENFGIAVAEAMVVGLPVIITPGVQIAPEIAEAKAGLIVEGEVDAVADATLELLLSPELRHKLGENGKRLVSRRYCWSAIAQNLSFVYSALLQKQPIPRFSSNLELK
jgi:glycosyltransferase involved in cell wall biosynthesis